MRRREGVVLRMRGGLEVAIFRLCCIAFRLQVLERDNERAGMEEE